MSARAVLPVPSKSADLEMLEAVIENPQPVEGDILLLKLRLRNHGPESVPASRVSIELRAFQDSMLNTERRVEPFAAGEEKEVKMRIPIGKIKIPGSEARLQLASGAKITGFNAAPLLNEVSNNLAFKGDDNSVYASLPLSRGTVEDLQKAAKGFADALARNKVISVGAPYMSREWFVAHRPYVWSNYPDCTITTEAATNYNIQRLAGRPAAHAGGDLAARERKLALVVPNNTEYRQCADTGEQLLEGTGVEIDLRLEYLLDTTQLQSQASSILAKLGRSSAGATMLGSASSTWGIRRAIRRKARQASASMAAKTSTSLGTPSRGERCCSIAPPSRPPSRPPA